MRLLAAMLLCAIGLSGPNSSIRFSAEPFPHDAYIWQRAWTPEVVSALYSSADIMRTWRILLAEADRSGRWTPVVIPWADVASAGRPVVGVVRIDGRLDETRMQALLDRIPALASAGPPTGLLGIEIDYDCPTSKLAAYAQFLMELRRRLPAPVALSITALPTWMTSREMQDVARAVSEVVLQVHAVDDPRRGLFDSERAEAWVRQFDRSVGQPFRVALPAYDVRVTWRADGRLASVEGETPLLVASVDSELLGADPQDVLRLLRALKRAPPRHLAGIAWFRLPTDADARAWSARTWRAVIEDDLPGARVSAVLEPAEMPELWTVVLANTGAGDAPLPRRIALGSACQAADGANGFRLVQNGADSGAQLFLEPRGAGRLRAGNKRVVGWVRCTQPERELHVVP